MTRAQRQEIVDLKAKLAACENEGAEGQAMIDAMDDALVVLVAKLAACEAPAEHPQPVIAPPVGPFTTFDGKYVSAYGVYWGSWEQDWNVSREFRKLHVKNHRRDNVRLMAWANGGARPVDPPALVEDCIFEDASATPPRSLDGTAESNLWVGCSATVRRVILRRGAWMGLWTGGSTSDPKKNCYRSTFEDMLIEEQRVGIYVEHKTRESAFRRFEIEARESGITVEWWYGGSGSANNTFEDFDITITGTTWGPRDGYGIMVDAGNYGHTFRNGVIRGGKGIELPKRLVDPSQPNVVEDVVDEAGIPVKITYHDRAIG